MKEKKILLLFKIIRTCIGVLCLVSIPILFVGSCVSGVINSLVESDDPSAKAGMIMVYTFFVLGILSIVVGRFILTKLVIIISFITVAINGLLNLGGFELVLYFSLVSIIFTIYYIIDFIYTLITKKKNNQYEK